MHKTVATKSGGNNIQLNSEQEAELLALRARDDISDKASRAERINEISQIKIKLGLTDSEFKFLFNE